MGKRSNDDYRENTGPYPSEPIERVATPAGKQVGGSSRLSEGHFYAAGTSIQREAGIEGDTAEAMFEHYMTLNQWMVEPSVVWRFFPPPVYV